MPGRPNQKTRDGADMSAAMLHASQRAQPLFTNVTCGSSER